MVVEQPARDAWIASSTTASYFWRIVKDGVTLEEYVEGAPERKIAEWPRPPFTLVAEPHPSPGQTLPFRAVEIQHGDEPIWMHRARQTYYLDGTPMTEIDALVFGVRRATGDVSVQTIDHNGTICTFASVDSALAQGDS